jgi:chromosome segregation ATPase
MLIEERFNVYHATVTSDSAKNLLEHQKTRNCYLEEHQKTRNLIEQMQVDKDAVAKALRKLKSAPETIEDLALRIQECQEAGVNEDEYRSYIHKKEELVQGRSAEAARKDEELQSLRNESEKKEKQIKEEKARRETVEANLAQLKARYDSHDKAFNELDATKRKLKQAESQLDHSRRERDDMKSENTQMRATVEDSRHQLQKFKQRAEEAERAQRTLSSDCTETQQKVTSLASENRVLHSQIADLKVAREKDLQRSEQLSSELSMLKREKVENEARGKENLETMLQMEQKHKASPFHAPVMSRKDSQQKERELAALRKQNQDMQRENDTARKQHEVLWRFVPKDNEHQLRQTLQEVQVSGVKSIR